MITQFKVRNNFLLNSLFFPSALVEWNNLDSDIRNFSSHWIFKKNILTFVRPRSNDVFNVSHPKGHNFLTCLHVGLSYLREHKFKLNFLDTLNPICICGFFISKHWITSFSATQDFSNEPQNFLHTIENFTPNFSKNQQ